MTREAKKINGRPVVNAVVKLKVHISPADAKSGKVRIPDACAAARAIKRDHYHLDARVHLSRAYVLRPDKTWVRYKTPEALRSEMIALDRGGKFQPGEYELVPLSPSDMTVNRPKRKSGKSHYGKYKSPRKLHVVKGVRPSAH